MKSREFATKIFEDLNKRGADLGNVSISIIEKSIDENVGLLLTPIEAVNLTKEKKT